MIRIFHSTALLLTTFLLVAPSMSAQSIDTPQTRMRPIGAASAVDKYRAVDQYRSSNQRADYRETVARRNQQIQQTQFAQNIDTPPLPNDSSIAMPPGFAPPPISAPSPSPATPTFSPPPMAERALPVAPNPVAQTPTPINPVPNRDYAPLAQPRLSNQFATLDNSCHVSAPSRYSAASGSGCCVPVGYQAPPAYIAPPAPVGPPTVIAPVPSGAPGLFPGATLGAAPTGAPAGSLLSFGQERYPVQVGQGLFGQPVAYVPGQKFRNWIRYFFP